MNPAAAVSANFKTPRRAIGERLAQTSHMLLSLQMRRTAFLALARTRVVDPIGPAISTFWWCRPSSQNGSIGNVTFMFPAVACRAKTVTHAGRLALQAGPAHARG